MCGCLLILLFFLFAAYCFFCVVNDLVVCLCSCFYCFFLLVCCLVCFCLVFCLQFVMFLFVVLVCDRASACAFCRLFVVTCVSCLM